jgi:hypothetical protein
MANLRSLTILCGEGTKVTRYASIKSITLPEFIKRKARNELILLDGHTFVKTTWLGYHFRRWTGEY